MIIERFALNELGTNIYVVADDDGEAMIIDPGAKDMEPVFAFVGNEGLRVRCIVNTHCHFDHVIGNEATRSRFRVPLLLHESELPLLRSAPDRMEHFLGYRAPVGEPDGWLREGDKLDVGRLRFLVFETPGHSPGGICLYESAEAVLFSGDTLFAGTVGRTDLPGSSRDRLMTSLREKLWPLPDETRVFPGHETDSTIGEERAHNPFFRFFSGTDHS